MKSINLGGVVFRERLRFLFFFIIFCLVDIWTIIKENIILLNIWQKHIMLDHFGVHFCTDKIYRYTTELIII